MERPTEVQLELETGVTQARLAEIAEVSPSTLRGYEKEGLISLLSNDGKKLYGPASLTDLMRVKTLKAEGLKLEEIRARLRPAPKSEAELLAELESARLSLEEARSKLAAVATQVGERVVTYRNELRLSKEELEAVEQLRQRNVRRALQVERKARAVKTQLQYRSAKPHIVRVDLPQAPKRKRR